MFVSSFCSRGSRKNKIGATLEMEEGDIGHTIGDAAPVALEPQPGCVAWALEELVV